MAARRTPLYEAHLRHGGKLVDFAGWEMPVQFSGILNEHRAVREAAGLFDVSHMGEIVFEGPGALEACNELISNDLARIADGQALYAGLLDDEGRFVDDIIAYRFSPERILLCVNAANAEKDWEWIRQRVREGVTVRDESPEWGQIALQGPKAAAILQRLCDSDLDAIRFFRFATVKVDGKEVIAARTGYTGEDGFELFCKAEETEALWEKLLETGAADGLLPCGLGARDSLRTEAGLCLYGNDIDRTRTPLEAGLGWIVKLDKEHFIGKDALVRQKEEGVREKLVGFELEGRGIPRQGYPIVRDGATIGKVTSGTMSPTLGKAIGMAYVQSEFSEKDQSFEVEIRGRPVPARIVPTPFYKRPA